MGPPLPPMFSLPYIPRISEAIKRIIMNLGFRCVFKKSKSLKDTLSNLKTPLSSEEVSGLIYQYQFSCGKKYIGQTSRTTSDRIKEHSDDFKHMRITRSASVAHTLDHGCSVNLSGVQILCKASKIKFEREILNSPDLARFV